MDYFNTCQEKNYFRHKSLKTIFRIMKLSFILYFVCMLQVFATGYSQTARISLSMHDVKIEEVLDKIEEQSEFFFLYNQKLVDLSKNVSIDVSELSINEVLNNLFNTEQIDFAVYDRQIILSPQGMLSTVEPIILQQTITITGTVTDVSGEPLPGVTVMIKGTTRGISTDLNGAYSLSVQDENAVLVFSSIGFISLEQAVRNQRTINVTLFEDIRQIEEVVVVGYGVQKKVSLTGSVSQVSGEEILSRPSTNVVNSMQGMMPGVTVLRSGGQPGSETGDLRIRGFTTVNSVSAMVLIDGIEGNLRTLNPDDIETISVLKDASTASIYGSRAAGGVILVTTKKGSTQKMNVNYNGSFGFNTPGILPKRLNPWEEHYMMVEARFAYNGTVEQQPDFGEWLSNPNYVIDIHPSSNQRYQAAIGGTNWMKVALREYTTTQRHAVSVTGGHGKTTYFMSGGYYTQRGLLKYGPDDNDRYNLRINLNTEINKYLEFKIGVAYENDITKRNSASASEILFFAYSNRGRERYLLPENDINYESSPYMNDLHQNIVRIEKEAGTNNSISQYVTGNANVHVKDLVKGLTVDFNMSRRFGAYNQQINSVFLEGQGRNGPRGGYDYNSPASSVEKTKNSTNQDKLEALINYRFNIDKHSVALLGGASYEQYKVDQMYARARYLEDDAIFSLNFYDNSDANNTAISDGVNYWKMASLFGRINYSYDDRYLLEFVARYDGSSRLSPGNRFGFFPGASAGWIVSEESFFKGLKDYVNFLKLRGSWGQLGNSSGLGYYSYIGTISRGGTYMGESYYSKTQMTSADVSWETVTTTNLAVDLSFLKRRLSLTGEYFWKTNDNMLSTMSAGNIVGVSSLPRENVGTLKVWGWEILASWRDKIGDVRYNVEFNIDDSNNKLVEYKASSAINNGTVDLLEGYPMYTLWGYQTDGFWNSRQEYLDYKEANPGYRSWDDGNISGGDTRYVPQGKADHTMGSIGSNTPDDPGDLIYMGNASPHYAFGLNLGVQWKGFDFSCFFQGIGKRKFFVSNTHLMPFGDQNWMPFVTHRDHWTEDNTTAYFARLRDLSDYNYYYADRWLQNGAYIRLKNIQLGYTVPITRYVKSLRVYVVGNDVWEYTKTIEFFDPEYSNMVETRGGGSNGRVNRNFYPFFRTCTMGVNLTF